MSYKDRKKTIIVITMSLFLFFFQVFLYNNEKQNIINTLFHSYIVGTEVQLNKFDREGEVFYDYMHCKEFEQLYTKKLISLPSVDDTKFLGLKLFDLLKNDQKSVFMHMTKKVECAFINHNRYFLLPSATYRIGSEFRDYVMIAMTQLNPFFRPAVGFFLLLISGSLSILTRTLLICGLFATVLIHINPEARYFFPFILAGIINSAGRMERVSGFFIKKCRNILSRRFTPEKN